ncbi:Double-stranded RNA-binding protein Staufen 1 [Portunus trituberculatus]|uniref:Double-stranded RNA-binding protein Staufen 1 n=1 Tax=Portunus trituberculatus TaxID=210409 RepID=A0A5B7CF87_PORTR|nr:Double-stranded RNA-binding protein Staufen 1 [Portunus trituberculatus]
MVGGNSVVGLSPSANGVSVSSASSANSPLTGVGPMGTDPSASSKEKTPMCLINELARYNKIQHQYCLTDEKGPAHKKTFTVTLRLGESEDYTASGPSIKKAQHSAAAIALEKTQFKHPPPKTQRQNKQSKCHMPHRTVHCTEQLEKEQKAAPEYGQGINPISRLIQIQQAKKEKEPVYTLLAERGVPRRREFIMQVTVGTQNAQGSGPNKKLAKRAAAENMLQLLGYSRPQPQPGKSAIKTDGANSDPDKTRKERHCELQVTFLEDGGDQRGSEAAVVGSVNTLGQIGGPAVGGGRQLVPGLIMMPDGSALHGFQQVQPQGMGVVSVGPMVNMQATATIAKELLKSGNSPTAEAMVKQSLPPAPQGSLQNPVSTTQAVRPKDQLMYLAQILGLQVQFTDFPKGNKSEYLSLVSLSTNPPHVSHGAGPTIDDSHDQACLTALRALAQMGLDTVTATKQE